MADFDPGDALVRYRRLVSERPQLFRNPADGNISILLADEEIVRAQREAERTRSAQNLRTEDLRVGVLAADPYMTYMRDAVRFADGSLGLYNRIAEGPCVAVLPVLDGQPVLIRIFRHGLRAWSWEAPRGDVRARESPIDAAKRELAEEIGATINRIVDLGSFTPGGASLAILGTLFLADINNIGTIARAESIIEVKCVSVEEMKRMIATGRIYDGFTISLLARAMFSGHL